MTKKKSHFQIGIHWNWNQWIKKTFRIADIKCVNIHADFPLKVKYFIKIINFISTYKGTG
jgi:hypothetical protein